MNLWSHARRAHMHSAGVLITVRTPSIAVLTVGSTEQVVLETERWMPWVADAAHNAKPKSQTTSNVLRMCFSGVVRSRAFAVRLGCGVPWPGADGIVVRFGTEPNLAEPDRT